MRPRVYEKLFVLLFFLIATISFFSSCSNNASTADKEKDSSDTGSTSVPASSLVNEECYVKTAGNDSVTLQLSVAGDSVTGTMFTRYSGKDKNSGALSGSFHNDTLLADYSFMSEGIQSVRQVAFLRRGDSLTEGFADVEERNGKMVFKNTGALKFEDKMSLKKVDCQ